ncbi:MAG: hypothetical protein C0623_06460 [Desulfuromonas sp.]|nr:MAG: hypothetical protein C0623_06460 [Desulfuromonas sp.]
MQKTAPLPGAFSCDLDYFCSNCAAGEFALRQTQLVVVAVAVGLRFSKRADGSDLKSSTGESKASMDSPFGYFGKLSTR